MHCALLQPKTRKLSNLAAENFPMTDYYDIEKTLTSMGIGEALVTVLNEKGIPTPLAHTMMRPPLSRIGVLTNGELQDIIDNSDIKEKYEKVVDRESAYELLQGKLSASKEEEEDEDNEEVNKSSQ
jgi:hypothetical protein